MPLITSAERIGTVLCGRYRVLSILGRGGMAVVFAAERMVDGRRVAVKLPRAECCDNLRAERLAQEAGATARVVHPNVVTVMDSGFTEDGLPFLVLERLYGVDLDGYLKEQGPLCPERALTVLLPVVGALAIAHAVGVVHRDLKPSNIFLHYEAGVCIPKLLDFGLARLVGVAGVTRSGTVVGTPDYMPPEQAAGEESATPAADTWSLSAVLLSCLTGLPPRSGDATSLVWPALALVLERGLRREPERRFATMHAWAEAVAVAARADGISLPLDPDPVGLPCFEEWYAGSASDSTISQEVPARAHALSSSPRLRYQTAVLALLSLFFVPHDDSGHHEDAPSVETHSPVALRKLGSGPDPGTLKPSRVSMVPKGTLRAAGPGTGSKPRVRELWRKPKRVVSTRPRLRPRTSRATNTPHKLAVQTSRLTDAGATGAKSLQREFGPLPRLNTRW